MEYAKINGKELSVITGLTTAAISQYKTGKILTLNAMAAQKIADALGVNVEWLVTGEGNMIKPNIISLDNADSDKLPAGFVQIPEYKICFGAGEAEEPTYEEIQDCVPAYFRSTFFASIFFKIFIFNIIMKIVNGFIYFTNFTYLFLIHSFFLN